MIVSHLITAVNADLVIRKVNYLIEDGWLILNIDRIILDFFLNLFLFYFLF